MITNVQIGQSIIDLMLQHTGSCDSLYDALKSNDINLEDDLTVGQPIILTEVLDKDVVNEFLNDGYVPANGSTIPELIEPDVPVDECSDEEWSTLEW